MSFLREFVSNSRCPARRLAPDGSMQPAVDGTGKPGEPVPTAPGDPVREPAADASAATLNTEPQQHSVASTGDSPQAPRAAASGTPLGVSPMDVADDRQPGDADATAAAEPQAVRGRNLPGHGRPYTGPDTAAATEPGAAWPAATFSTGPSDDQAWIEPPSRGGQPRQTFDDPPARRSPSTARSSPGENALNRDTAADNPSAAAGPDGRARPTPLGASQPAATPEVSLADANGEVPRHRATAQPESVPTHQPPDTPVRLTAPGFSAADTLPRTAPPQASQDSGSESTEVRIGQITVLVEDPAPARPQRRKGPAQPTPVNPFGLRGL